MIDFVEVAMGSGRAATCARCRGPRPDPVFRPAGDVVAEVRDVVSGWVSPPGPNVMLSGSEPFGHPELPRIVSEAIEAGVVRLGADTDAIALRSPANAAGSLAAGLRHLRVTLLGGSPGVHDALAGAPGLLDATLAGLGTYRAAANSEGLDISITAVVPLCGHNVHDAPAAVALAIEAGADRVLLRLEDGGVSLGDAARWIVAACDTGVVNGVWVEVEGAPFCVLPGYDLHLADAMRDHPGSKAAVCVGCPLDGVCGGAPAGASGDTLADLAVPGFAAHLAPQVARGRGEVALP